MSKRNKKKLFTHWAPDPNSKILGTGYKQFSTIMGIHGLAKIEPRRSLHVLAVVSDKPGQGQFEKFIEVAKHNYREICIWHTWNPGLVTFLKRNGFAYHNREETYGSGQKEFCSGLRWFREKRIEGAIYKPGDFPEDAGNSTVNHCATCQGIFRGFKRRVRCSGCEARAEAEMKGEPENLKGIAQALSEALMSENQRES